MPTQLQLSAASNPAYAVGVEVELAAGADWQPVAVVQRGGNAGEVVRFSGLVGSGGALTGLKVVRRLTPTGRAVDWLVDADLDSPGGPLLESSKTSGGASLYQTPADGTFEIAIDSRGVEMIELWAKGDDTTVTVDARG